MNAKVKIGAYAVLVLLAIWFAWGFHANYSAVTTESAPPPSTNETATAPTNNAVDTNSNAVASTNAAGQTNADASNAVAAPAPPSVPPPAPAAPAPGHRPNQGAMIAYLAALIVAIIGLGLLIAHDATQIVGAMAVDTLLDDRGEGMRDPEYEKAEEVWANGKFLEAIQMMRDFLKTNPREQYAALRIAEIYEKDLKNVVAAALEYEEVLKQKLPAERWGWAAIHLCNLYTKLKKQDQAMALLRRVADEYPKTAAAKKARSRLGLPEPEPESAAGEKPEGRAGEGSAESATAVAEEEEPEAESTPPKPEPPKSNLPPGFRPK
jgi:TolA-binding protein